MNDNLIKELNEFRNLSIVMKNLFIKYKDSFEKSTGLYTLLKDKSFEVKMYFADNYKTWSIKVGNLEYSDYKKSFDLPECIINDNKYISKANKSLLLAINIFKNKYICKKKELKFD